MAEMMPHRRLGASGLSISCIVLGCMGFGDPAAGTQPWAVEEEQAEQVIRQALDAGITLFDTANVYSAGASEEITGRILRRLGVREEVLIATKVYGEMSPGPKGKGLSRGAIMRQAEESLRRLGTDYIDLYQIHRFDPETPVEETMEALHDLIRSGRVRYIGASSMYAWQFAKLQHAAERHGWTRFIAMQDQYNLLMREEEREMHPLCLDEGVGVIPWSPLARGRLARPWGESSARSQSDAVGKTLYTQDEASDRAVVDAVGHIAGQRGVSRAQVALAWLLAKPAVTAPIVGATRPEHLDEAVKAVEVSLSDEEIATLEAPYTPRLPVAF